MKKDLECLHTEMREKARQFIKLCKTIGVDVIIYNTCRSLLEQEALFLQGRADIETVNRARQKAGLKPISLKENVIVTNTKLSPHCFGLAFDFVPIKDGKPVWNDLSLWEKCGSVAEKLDLVWGGRWKNFKDYPHVELKDWKKFAKVV
uniref:M15 family peptidase n=1 Tax=Fervidobacterium thailandense TaxID=1008305 RepID=A0A7C5RJT0_9BACT